jgi:hypothetical protein
VKRVYANASIVGENRVVLNIGGNKYRLIVAANYPSRMCCIRRSRALTIEMIRRLDEGLGISAETLIRPYSVRRPRGTWNTVE